MIFPSPKSAHRLLTIRQLSINCTSRSIDPSQYLHVQTQVHRLRYAAAPIAGPAPNTIASTTGVEVSTRLSSWLFWEG